MDNIWVIETYRYGTDSNGRDTVDTEVESDYGYFLDRDSAQAKADVLNTGVVADYYKYLADGAIRKERMLADNARQIREWKILQEAGLINPNPTLTEETINLRMWLYELPFEVWIKRKCYTYYIPLELALNKD